MRLQDKVAIVTGAGSGFGESIARRFAQEGAKVVVADINAEGGKRVAGAIHGEFIQADDPINRAVPLRSRNIDVTLIDIQSSLLYDLRSRLLRPRFQFGVEEIHDAGLAAEAQERFAYHVGAEEREKVERFAGVEEGVGELHGVLGVNVVVGEAVDE